MEYPSKVTVVNGLDYKTISCRHLLESIARTTFGDKSTTYCNLGYSIAVVHADWCILTVKQ